MTSRSVSQFIDVHSIDIDLLLELGPRRHCDAVFLVICTSGVAYGTILDAFAKAFKIRKPSTGQVPGSRAENGRRTTQHAKNLDRQASLMMPYK